MSSKLIWNQRKIDRIQQKTMEALVDLGEDTAYRAQLGAPVASGALVNSIRTTTNNKDTVFVLAGGTSGKFKVPYARKREFQNKLHPDKRFFMTKAMDWAEPNYLKYFKGITK